MNQYEMAMLSLLVLLLAYGILVYYIFVNSMRKEE